MAPAPMKTDMLAMAKKNLSSTDFQLFQDLWMMQLENLDPANKANLAILGFKAAGLNEKLEVDGKIGDEMETALEKFMALSPDQTTEINLGLFGLRGYNPKIIPDGIIGDEAWNVKEMLEDILN